MFFFTACHDDIYSDITNGGNGVEHNRQPLDSMDLYNIQIEKSTILTNLIRNNNGRYYLDLTEQDAEILRQFGISICLEKFQLPTLFNVHGQCLWLILEETVCSQCRTNIHEEVMYGAMA